jgi:HK97 family phage major capsid protein
LTAYFVGESEAITESEKNWDRIGLTAKKLAVLARITSELSEDSVINIGDDLMREMSYAFAKKEDECGFNGDGTSTYGGIVGVREKLKGVDGTIGNIKGLKVGTGNAYTELTLADFRGVVSLLPEYADTPNAKWFVNRSFYWNVMVGLLLAGGGVTAAEIEAARNKNFLGYGVETTPVMPKVEANSQVCAILGDLSLGARFGSRRGETVSSSEHSRFAYDEIEVKATERFDINVHDVGDTTDAGPVVGLITAAA